jgi:hypothetical protein
MGETEHTMRKRKQNGIPEPQASHEREADTELNDLQDVLQSIRNSRHAAAERPELYWKKQHEAIMTKLNASAPAPQYRFAYLWIPAAAVVLLLLFFSPQSGKAPPPDFAAGYDQDLLVDVERALSRDCPIALNPAALLTREVEQGSVLK